VTDARVDARAGRVSAGAGSWPFALDCRTGGATLDLGGGELEVRPLRWREKVRLARFAFLGVSFLDEQVLRLALPAGDATPDGDAREAALALALWLNDPGDADPLPLQVPLLATATIEVCSAMGVAPSALDDRDAVEVEALWRAVAERGPAPAELPGTPAAPASAPAFRRSGGGGGTVEVGETRRIVFVPDPPAAAAPRAVPPETAVAPKQYEEPAPAAAARPAPAPVAATAPGTKAPSETRTPREAHRPPRPVEAYGGASAPPGGTVAPTAAGQPERPEAPEEPVPVAAALRAEAARAPAQVGEAAMATRRGEAAPRAMPTPRGEAPPQSMLPPSTATSESRTQPAELAAEAPVTPSHNAFRGPARAQLSSALLRRAPSVPAPVAARAGRTAAPWTAAPAAPAPPTAEAPVPARSPAPVPAPSPARVPARSPAPARPAAEARPPAAVVHATALDTDELLDELSERLALAAAELGVEA
jgi:hypothetical protein